MIDPVIDKEGNSWERSSILDWISTHHTSPLTRNRLEATDLSPNRALKDLIEAFQRGENVQLPPPTPAISNQLNEIHDEFKITAFIKEKKVLLSIEPSESTIRTPVDVCCVIDISGSMGANAEIPNGESTGLSVLDIVKHAVKTIIKSMNPKDRLAIVSFSNTAETVIPLTEMTINGQALAITALEQLQPTNSTNLWAGLERGMEVLRDGVGTNLKACFILTDGESNSDPPRGILPTFKTYRDKKGIPGIVNTFGFGYSLDSKLLSNIAKTGMGAFSFIPDAGFVGTIFVHAIANLMTTLSYATKLKIEPAEGVKFKNIVGHPNTHSKESWGLSIELSQIHSGQPVHIILELENDVLDGSELCNVNFETIARIVGKKEMQISLKAEEKLEENKLIDREYYRSLMVETVITQFQLATSGDLPAAAQKLKEFAQMISSIPNISGDPQTKDLLIDLKGQITEAFQPSYYEKWGKHYLPSIIYAHQYQTCNNFKDPGVQHYGKVLFNHCRDLADELFTNLPPPIPAQGYSTGSSYNGVVSMSQFNNSSNVCFSGECLVEMGDKSFKMVKDVVSGDFVFTPDGPARVLYKLESIVPSGKVKMIQIGKLLVTPYHPVIIDESWVFPANAPLLKPVVVETYSVYNFMLELGHVISIEGIQAVTVGHCFTDSVCAHPYFGTNLIREDISKFEEGTLRIVGVQRNSLGLVSGLIFDEREI